MLENQVKNNIKLVLTALILTVIGEGVFGLGLYWPVLVLMLDWDRVYWLAFVIGIFVSVFAGIPVGFPSLLLVVITGIFSLVLDGRRTHPAIVVISILVANIIFDKLLGFNSGLIEVIVVGVTSVLLLGWGEKNESIHIRYK